MSQHRISQSETKFLEEAATAESVSTTIRLREGEYQYNLVRGIASFHLELVFPDVRDIIRRLYGEEKTQDLQFVRKIQTILKKMEKSNIVRILPKKNPWQLQRYGLSSFKFIDSDKNLVVLATDQQIEQMQSLIRATLTKQSNVKREYFRVLAVVSFAIAAYVAVVWALVQPIINPIVFVPALFISVICSLILGEVLARR